MYNYSKNFSFQFDIYFLFQGIGCSAVLRSGHRMQTEYPPSENVGKAV